VDLFDNAYTEILATPGFEWDDWARDNLAAFRPRHLLLARLLDKHLAGGREVIADVGCHNGFFLRLSSHLQFRKFLGVDFFEVPAARSFLQGLQGAEFHLSNFSESGFLKRFADESVDCVCSTEVFEHLFNRPFGYLSECWRILRRNGVLALTTPNPATLANSLRVLLNRPVQWGAVMFAETDKVSSEGQPAAFWDIHFREYFYSEMREIIAKLPGVKIVESGYIATQAGPKSSWRKRAGKWFQWTLGLGKCRPFCATQYWLLLKQ
jgi:SAM-dependent methyltransferase